MNMKVIIKNANDKDTPAIGEPLYFLFPKGGQSTNRLIWFNDSVVFDHKEGKKHAQNGGAFLY